MRTYVSGSTPYEWPFDGLRPSRLAVVVAGADDHWTNRVEGVSEVAARIGRLSRSARAAGVPVVHVRHRRGGVAPGPVTSLGSPTFEVVAEGVDGCFGSGLESTLRGRRRTQVALVGFGLEGPVHSTLRSLNDRGFECLTVADACASLVPEITEAALSTIRMSGGIFGAVGAATELITALEEAI